jgi:hypothetical protein
MAFDEKAGAVLAAGQNEDYRAVGDEDAEER